MRARETQLSAFPGTYVLGFDVKAHETHQHPLATEWCFSLISLSTVFIRGTIKWLVVCQSQQKTCPTDMIEVAIKFLARPSGGKAFFFYLGVL